MTHAESDLAHADAAVDRRCDELRSVWRRRYPYRRLDVCRAMLALRDAVGVQFQARRAVQMEAMQ